MKTYKINFEGVTVGSIGKKKKFTLTIKADNWEDANLKMYDTHEHIRIFTVNSKPYDYNALPSSLKF